MHPMALVSTKVEVAHALDAHALDAALEAIYQAELAWVMRTLARLGCRPADIEDLAHDVFVVVHRSLDRLDRARPVRPWLFGIAFRVVSDYRARARFTRERAVGDIDDAPDDGATPEGALAAREARVILLRALDSLPFDQRAVFVACEIDETPMPVLAAELGLSINTLYSRLRLARTRMAAAVQVLTSEGGHR